MSSKPLKIDFLNLENWKKTQTDSKTNQMENRAGLFYNEAKNERSRGMIFSSGQTSLASFFLVQ
jgi:hypothetical protein